MNENTLTVPEAWSRHLHARRGGAPGPQVKVAKSAVEKARAYVGESKDALGTMLAGEYGEQHLTEAARRYLDGEADPAGAAVVALVAAYASRVRDLSVVLKTFLDAWVLEHGLPFAACAVLRLDSTQIMRRHMGAEKSLGYGAQERPGAALTGDAAGCGRRMRGMLAVAEQAEYDAAVERLAGLRDTPDRRLAVSYLVPTRHDWMLECCNERAAWRNDKHRWQMLLSIGAAEHLDVLRVQLYWNSVSVELMATMVDGLGADVLPVLVESFDRGRVEPKERQRLVEVVALLPTDEAFTVLTDRLDEKYVRPALLDAMRRFPGRALRLLAAAVADARAGGDAKRAAGLAEVLGGHLLSHPELAAEMVPGLAEESRELIETISASNTRVPQAPVDALPRLLVEPPWTNRRTAAKPVVIAGLTPAVEPGMHWAEGEREAWSVRVPARWGVDFPEGTDWTEEFRKLKSGRMHGYAQLHLMTSGPDELVRPLLGGWGGKSYWDADDLPWLRCLAGRYETDALPLVMRAARSNPATNVRVLFPYLHADVAALMAELVDRVKSARVPAMAWFARHGVDGARLLFPAALGKAGKERRQAEGALLLIAARVGAEAIVTAAREAHGDAAADAIAVLLETDPLDRLPAKIPQPSAWADPVLLPQMLMRGRDAALPVEAAGHLITMLAMSKPGEMYAGVDAVRELCDPESLAEFSWGVFRQWEEQGAPSKDGWALQQLAWLGDDETVRRLTPVIRAWPGVGGHQKAVNGLDVLAEIGSEVALLHLHGISQKVKFKGLKARAQDKIEEVATALELTSEQLADRLVPDFGLDADGGMTLDYGPRRFHVGFDEQLKPYVTDEDGKRRKALPKPGVKDDEETANAAYKAFAGLKKDIRTIASDQVNRLESAMGRRRWTPGEFRTLFVAHPLMWHIARRLIWIAEDAGTTTAFRIAEDRSLADVEDEAFDLPGSAAIGIAHPLELGESVAAWSDVLADYEILQPFPQLGREVHTLTDEERAAGTLARFEKITVPVYSVLGLVGRGWERGMPLDAGGERWISKPVPGRLHVIIDLHYGISVGVVEDSGDQTLEHVWINDHPTDYRPHRGPSTTGTTRTFGELDPVTASEVLADLTWLAAAAL
ncbi:DUF4132 domain-containing protein [Actinomadura sp. 9N407]|uniref:DUF4132 domain-containing protein n=1 Tax=Actinomadura sp. 9N407 TaxID=3375154 RepID=UPI0037AF76EA